MTIEWNNKNVGFNSNVGNDMGYFEEHDECMREFRKSHADVALVNGERLDKAAFPESLLPLQARRSAMGTIGAVLLNDTTNWSSLVPMWRVARYKLSQN